MIALSRRLQHEWAELSEKLSDAIDPQIKYGGGRPDIRTLMDSLSQIVAGIEADEASIPQWQDHPLRQRLETDTQHRRAQIRAMLQRLATDVGGVGE